MFANNPWTILIVVAESNVISQVNQIEKSFHLSLTGQNMRVAVFMVLLFTLSSMYVQTNSTLDEVVITSETSHHSTVSQFGAGFDEILIADSTDNLNEPRDLEFHPGSSRSDELWIVNRATDSVTIIHDTGLSTQWSEHREDSNRNHFMEEVSAIAFGAYSNEFDYQFSTAQESRNTFNGQGSPNNFMGPALWPSSLSHFAVENQNGPLLGSHIDMLHESPYGMGVAHDSENAYWYYDGYYGDLVYYDFQEDHDTGEDDHSDGIVRRYSEISLSRSAGTPSHMVLDKDSGILYIADSGSGRVLWVDTDDPTTTSTNIYNSNTRMEPLHEYSSITGVSWGVLASGMSRPSGIALDGDTLFVSTNGNGQIRAYDLGTTPTTATLLQTVNTAASKIMGLEIGPDEKLYYVDGFQDKVIRLDPLPDNDDDGIADVVDNCPNIQNNGQENHDSDSLGDACDTDDDNDGKLDVDDDCEIGMIDWISDQTTDYDADGCNDLSEDDDDDEDTILDIDDRCSKGMLDWFSNNLTDYDTDGCQDLTEDFDDDSDGMCDIGGPNIACSKGISGQDMCPLGRIGFISRQGNDIDGDGCEDSTEDFDDDGDGYPDEGDDCPLIPGTSSQGGVLGCIDLDADGWAESVDAFVYDGTQWSDIDEDGYGDNADGNDSDACVSLEGDSLYDRFGCHDSDGDGWSDPTLSYAVEDGADAFPSDSSQWSDRDGDGYGDEQSGNDSDVCPDIFGTSMFDRLGCLDTDGDGRSDEGDALPNEPTQWDDYDLDGFGDRIDGEMGDSCPTQFGTSTIGSLGCLDSDNDGVSDSEDLWPEDSRIWSDGDGDGFADQSATELSDDCPLVEGYSDIDQLGCLDSDSDGVSDEEDFYPYDSKLTVEQVIYEEIWFWAMISILVLIPMTWLIVRKNKAGQVPNTKQWSDPVLPLSLSPIADPAELGPAIPPEGIPPGWTMEQWNYYGQQWLIDQGRV
jgi:hypothetical protein